MWFLCPRTQQHNPCEWKFSVIFKDIYSPYYENKIKPTKGLCGQNADRQRYDNLKTVRVFDVCVTVHHWYNNKQPISCNKDNFIYNFNQLRRVRGNIVGVYTTSCKHSLVLLKMGESIAQNMLSWLKLLIKLSLLHLVDYIIMSETC